MKQIETILFQIDLKSNLQINCKIKKHPHIIPNFYLFKLFESYRFLSRYINDPAWSLDIGANMGIVSLALAACCGKKGRVICIEPNLENCNLIYENLQANQELSKFDIYDIGFSDINGLQKFIFSESLDNGVILKNDEQKDNYSYIMCRNAYSFLSEKYEVEELKKIQFIKIDTEGHDYKILSSLSPLIDLINPYILIEEFPDEEIKSLLSRKISELELQVVDSLLLATEPNNLLLKKK